MVGCAAKDREFGPANNAGENGSGGTGQAGKGGSSGKGNTSGGTDANGATGGAAGEAGSGGTGGGRGGTSGRGGSAGVVNAAGDAGAEANGGEGGDGTVPDPECVPTGAELCADGLDNDCDGATDCLVLQSEFPTRNGAASGADVAYEFSTPAATATLQCRVTRGNAASGTWRACARLGGTTTSIVQPFSTADSADPAKNGLYLTEVRLRFPTGGVSDAFRRPVYIHDSLNGATRCDTGIGTPAWVTQASTVLPAVGAFDPTTVRNPFVEIDFDPLVSSTFAVEEGAGTVKWSTLRRRFSFSADNQYLVMTRTYTARLGDMACHAAIKRVHTARGDDSTGVMAFQKCDALVFNKSGAGICLANSAGTPVSAEYNFGSPQLMPPDYVSKVDNFAWRKLGAYNVLTDGTRQQSNFSPKCDEDGCASGDALFLPGKEFYPYWAD
jgi:hypothetical protein